MGNGTLFLNTVNYLAAQEDLIGIPPRTPTCPRVNLTNRQMKGTFFAVGAPRPRPARRGRDGGVVEAALSAGPARRRRLVLVWGLLGMLVAGIAAIESGRPPSRRSGRGRRRSAPARAGARGPARRARGGRRRDACIASSATRAGAWFYHGVHTGAEGAHEHAADPALAERIERAVTAFARTRVERDFAPGTDGARLRRHDARESSSCSIGRGPSQPLAQYAVGHLAPDTVEPVCDGGRSSGRGDHSDYQIDNLLALTRGGGRETATGLPRGPGVAMPMTVQGPVRRALALAGRAPRRRRRARTPAAAPATPRFAVHGASVRYTLTLWPAALPPAIGPGHPAARAPATPPAATACSAIRPREGDARSPRAGAVRPGPGRCSPAPRSPRT